MQTKAALKTSLQRHSGWLIPAGLILLSILPLVGGIVRMVDLTTGESAPGTARFSASPSPVVVHVISSLTYFVLGAFQFSPSLRRSKPGWHRKAGYVLIPSGLLCALSGAWMAWFYPPVFGTGTSVAIIRIAVAAAITASICAGFVKIRERNVAAHRAWMMRAYALAIAAGTQPITLALILVFPGELGFTLGLAAGWVLNLLVAEWLIRRTVTRDPKCGGGKHSALPSRQRPLGPEAVLGTTNAPDRRRGYALHANLHRAGPTRFPPWIRLRPPYP